MAVALSSLGFLKAVCIHTHTHTSDRVIKLSILDRWQLVFYVPLWLAVPRQKKNIQAQVVIYVKVT